MPTEPEPFDEVQPDLIRAARRVGLYCRWKAGQLVGYDQTEDALDALYELDVAASDTTEKGSAE